MNDDDLNPAVHVSHDGRPTVSRKKKLHGPTEDNGVDDLLEKLRAEHGESGRPDLWYAKK